MKYPWDWLKYRVLFPLVKTSFLYVYRLKLAKSRTEGCREKEDSKKFVFIFLGEFGYELLDWQGKVKYFQKKYPKAHVISVSRDSSRYLYESCKTFFGLDHLGIYLNSTADSYFARSKPGPPKIIKELFFSARINRCIKREIRTIFPEKRLKFIFSNRTSYIDGVRFGANMLLHGKNVQSTEYGPGIYFELKSEGNDIQLSSENLKQPETKKHPYLLFMTARREIHKKDSEVINENDYLKSIQNLEIDTILLEFGSNRAHDTIGSFKNVQNDYRFSRVRVESLYEQLKFLANATACIFFSEGDLRSLTYLPPLIGKDVYIVCSQNIATLKYIQYWNEEIFCFGGKMRFILNNVGSFQTAINEILKNK